jgi:ABC-2 type transport system ATP-binding protein
MTASPAVVVDQMTKRYAGRAVVDRLSLVVRAGEVLALLGPNGAGKTTTVESIEGYRRPDGGSVRVLGEDPATGGPALKARIGLMLQGGGGVYPQATPREMLRLFAAFHRPPADVGGLIDLAGLGQVADRRYRQLSGGEKQRLALAIALVGDPEVLVLDEPTAGMDPAARVTTRELIAGLRNRGAAILLTTHDLTDVELMADRVILVDRGRAVVEGTPSELAAGGQSRLRFRMTSKLLDADRRGLEAALLDGRPGTLADEGGARYALEGPAPSPDLVERLAHWSAGRGLLIEEVSTGGGTLEERYLSLIGSEAEPDR